MHFPDPINAVIEYDGRGIGFETVKVNGVTIARKCSLFWFVPHFEFAFQSKSGIVQASIDVRVTPWFTLSRFVIRVENMEVYAEM